MEKMYQVIHELRRFWVKSI